MKRRGDWATKVVDAIIAFVCLMIVAAVVGFLLLFSGCASTGVPEPLIGEVKTQTINVAVPVPCGDPAKLPKRPAVHAAPVGSDAVQHASGMKADAEDLRLYATELEAEIRRCSTLPTTNGGK